MPTGSLINVLPAPTSKSPSVYDVFPVPPYLAVIAVADQLPVVITPLLRTTPEILSAVDVPVNKLPPIPTPPVTVNAPVEVDVETVELEITKSLVKVLIPAND